MTSQKAPHLLYVAWGFPPCRGGGVYRALATANAFARAGWRVTVLTVDRETFLYSTGIDSTLENEIDPRVVVKRIPFKVPAYQNDLGAWSRARAQFPELWNGWRAWRDRKTFPEVTYGGWRPELEAAALEIHSAEPVDLALGTANPNVDFTACMALFERHRVPFVMDYRDAWQLDVFTGKRTTSSDSEVAKWEARLVAAAHEVWFVNEPIRSWHQELYPSNADKLQVVANGYDDEFANFPHTVRADRDAGIVFGYIGTISGRVPLQELLDGWRLARTRSPLLRKSKLKMYGYLDFSGIPNERLLNLFAEFADDGVEFCGPVGKTAIAETYASFDALLLVLGKGKYVTSGKVFEYAATGLPIVSIHDPGNAASDVLEAHPSWVATADLRADTVASALIAGGELSVVQTADARLATQDWAARFERSNQLEPRVAALREFVDTLLNERGRP